MKSYVIFTKKVGFKMSIYEKRMGNPYILTVKSIFNSTFTRGDDNG